MKFFKANSRIIQHKSALCLAPALYPYPRSGPSSKDFEQLKKVERCLFSRKRFRFDYKDNFSSALALPCSYSQLRQAKSNESALLRLAEDNIIEHANRRIDLFFYTLVAYYHTNALPVEGHTTLQHGKGRTFWDHTNVTQACHSSLLPSLLDQSILRGRRKSILSHTHFLNNLNSTVELPAFVNAFDGYLESICRSPCMNIIRRVSLGQLNPVEGLNQVLNLMNTLLRDFKIQAASKGYTSLKFPLLGTHSYVQPRLIDLVIKGTLGTTFSAETCTVKVEYVRLLLRITPQEKERCLLSPENEKTVYMQKILELQQEILQSKNDDNLYTL